MMVNTFWKQEVLGLSQYKYFVHSQLVKLPVADLNQELIWLMLSV